MFNLVGCEMIFPFTFLFPFPFPPTINIKYNISQYYLWYVMWVVMQRLFPHFLTLFKNFPFIFDIKVGKVSFLFRKKVSHWCYLLSYIFCDDEEWNECIFNQGERWTFSFVETFSWMNEKDYKCQWIVEGLSGSSSKLKIYRTYHHVSHENFIESSLTPPRGPLSHPLTIN